MPSPYLVPTTLRKANDFVAKHHRHNGRTSRDGGKWAASVCYEGVLVGVAIVGRPLARMLDDGWTAEVLRVCVSPDAPTNTCSMLYGASWRCWKAMGGRRIVTYTLQTEPGTSLRAAGFKIAAELVGKEWNSPSRPRKCLPIYKEDKYRWEIKVDGEVPALPAPDFAAKQTAGLFDGEGDDDERTG